MEQLFVKFIASDPNLFTAWIMFLIDNGIVTKEQVMEELANKQPKPSVNDAYEYRQFCREAIKQANAILREAAKGKGGSDENATASH